MEEREYKVGQSIFYGTAKVTNIDGEYIVYKCSFCGQESRMKKDRKIQKCAKCQYNNPKYDSFMKKAKIRYKDIEKQVEAKKNKQKAEKKIEEESRLRKGRLRITEEKNELDYMVQCSNCTKKYKYRKTVFDERRNPMCLYCGTRGGYENKEGKDFGFFKITRELGGGNVEAFCSTCGEIREYNKNSIVNKTCKCKVCRNEGETADPIGWAKGIVNNLYIIKEQEKGNQASSFCLVCGKFYKLPIGTFIDGTAKCKCITGEEHITCSYCGKKTYEINENKKIAGCTNSMCISNNRNRGHTYREKMDYLKSSGLYVVTMKDEYNKSIDKVDFTVKQDAYGKMNLIVFRKPIYVGRDRIPYYKTYCLLHKKFVLVQTSIVRKIEDTDSDLDSDYGHELCDYKYDMYLNETE